MYGGFIKEINSISTSIQFKLRFLAVFQLVLNFAFQR